VQYGVPGLWFTINPGDLVDPLVLQIAGEDVSIASLLKNKDLKELKVRTSTENPAVVATFFAKIMESFFSILVRPGDDRGGIFGHVGTYFATTETNGRGMLHVHGLMFFDGEMGSIFSLLGP
jgi:hypothetical protein